MGLWTDRIVPRLTDKALSSAEVGPWRDRACAGLHGRILEVGFGSGLNLSHYPRAVESVHAVEPSDTGWALSARRRAAAGLAVERSGRDGEHLDGEPDESFDGVLSTFTLCTIPDPERALAEVRRVLRPGAAFHFLEHGVAPDPGVVRWQRRLDPLQRRLFAGCHLSRDIVGLVEGAGLAVQGLEQRYLPGPRASRPWGYGYVGRGVRQD